MWITTPHHVGNTSTGITSKSATDCADSLADWQYFNGTQFQYDRSLKSSCAKIENTCCKHIEISSPASNRTKDNSSLTYTKEAKQTLGRYTAVGTINGRYIYQHDDMDRYLEFDESKQNWLIVLEIGCTSGFIYHSGGSVCPEHSGTRWHIASFNEEKNTTSWKHDPEFNISCAGDKDESKETSEEPSSETEASVKETTTLIVTTSSATTTKTLPVRTSTTTVKLSTKTTETTIKKTSSTPSRQEKTTTLAAETPATEENQKKPQADPLISESEESGTSVTPIVVSLLFLAVFVVLAIMEKWFTW